MALRVEESVKSESRSVMDRDRGSNFASIRKDADLLMVFSCMNGNKPMNVRYSTTPKGERLTNSYVNGLLSGITKSVKTTGAR
jgi:hypothetical protein